MGFFTELSEINHGLEDIQRLMKELKRSEVLVGIPDDNVNRPVKKGDPTQKSPVTNAELLYIHTHGSPVNHIPPRPVLEPAISNSKAEISAELKQASLMALDGNQAGMEAALKRAGTIGQNAARGWFVNPANGWAPNSQVTIEGSEKGENGRQFIKGKGSSKPLIDTGQMRKAITYKIRKK